MLYARGRTWSISIDWHTSKSAIIIQVWVNANVLGKQHYDCWINHLSENTEYNN